MKKFLSIAAIFVIILCLFCGCGSNDKLYNTLSFLNEEQSRLMSYSYEINEAATSPAKYINMTYLDAEPVYESQDGTLYVFTDMPWDEFTQKSLELFTEDYIDTLVANGLYVKIRGNVAAACVQQKIQNSALNSVIRYRLVEKDDDRVVFEELRLHFLRREDEPYDDFLKRMEKCKEYDNVFIACYTLANTENGWRVDNIIRRCGTKDKLSSAFPADIHTTDENYIATELSAYIPQSSKIFEPLLLEAENIGRAVIASMDTMSADISKPEFDCSRFLIYLCEEDKPHYPYYNFAQPAGGTMRSFDEDVCREILETVTGESFEDVSIFDENFYFNPDTDTYMASVKELEKPVYITQTAYMHKISDSGLDCTITHFVNEKQADGESYEQIGLGKFYFKLNTATNHWQLDKFEYTPLF